MKAVTWLASFTVGVASLAAPAFANTLEGWSTDLDKALAEKNKPLAEKYKIEGFPTVILLNSEGKEFNRFFASEFPKAEDFLKHLDETLEQKGMD